MDGISRLYINTPNLEIINNNSSEVGDAMYLNQKESKGLSGGLFYNSSISSSSTPVVNGTIYVADINFGEALRRQKLPSIFSLAKFKGPNAKVSFVNTSQLLSVNNSILDESGIIPGKLLILADE